MNGKKNSFPVSKHGTLIQDILERATSFLWKATQVYVFVVLLVHRGLVVGFDRPMISIGVTTLYCYSA